MDVSAQYIDFAAYGYLTLVGAVLGLDRVAFMQSLVSRPLFVSLIVGWLAGDVETGVACGLLLELIWLAKLPVGGSVPPDDTTAAVVAVASALLAPQQWSVAASAALGVVASMPFAYLGRRFDLAARKRNTLLVDRARAELQSGSTKGLARYGRQGVLNFFIAGALAVSLSLFMARALVLAALNYHPEALEGGMEIMAVLIPVIGAGSFLVALPGWRCRTAFGVGVAGSAAGLTAGFAGLKASLPLFFGKLHGAGK
jgi:PTS system mannose-specific IIC component